MPQGAKGVRRVSALRESVVADLERSALAKDGPGYLPTEKVRLLALLAQVASLYVDGMREHDMSKIPMPGSPPVHTGYLCAACAVARWLLLDYHWERTPKLELEPLARRVVELFTNPDRTPKLSSTELDEAMRCAKRWWP